MAHLHRKLLAIQNSFLGFEQIGPWVLEIPCWVTAYTRNYSALE